MVQGDSLAVLSLTEQASRPSASEKHGWTLVQKRKEKHKAFKHRRNVHVTQTEYKQKCNTTSTHQGTSNRPQITFPASSPRSRALSLSDTANSTPTMFVDGNEDSTPNGLKPLDPPARMVLPHCEDKTQRDMMVPSKDQQLNHPSDSEVPSALNVMTAISQAPLIKSSSLSDMEDMEKILEDYYNMISDLTLSKDDRHRINSMITRLLHAGQVAILSRYDEKNPPLAPFAPSPPPLVTTDKKLTTLNARNGACPRQPPPPQPPQPPIQRIASNHCPLLLTLATNTKIKISFKFIGAWTMQEDFLNLVSKHLAGDIQKDPLYNFGMKLKSMRSALTKWNWDTFEDVNKMVKEKQSLVDTLELQLQGGWTNDIHLAVVLAKKDLATFLRYQYIMLEDKARVNWICEGDRDTSLLHASIKARHIHNNIRLLQEDGSCTDDVDTIGQAAATYFKSFFGSFPEHADIVVDDLIHMTISDSQNVALCCLPDEEEIHSVIQNMNPNSSPSPDGFTGKFYNVCWIIIKDYLIRAVHGFFEGLHLPKIILATDIILLPQVKQASTLQQIRPISLCNFCHKVISNILNSRLKKVLSGIISKEQSGFLEGRNIHETIGVAHDLVRDINHKVFGGNIMLKLDMSKAYDRLSWRFLLHIMRAFGFSHQWCDLIFQNISNCWYSISWGGKRFEFFKSNRGVCQGDPISSSLFIHAMDYFSRLYNSTVQNNTIKSYIVASGVPPIHHLLYADDLLIFSSRRKDSVRKALFLIDKFCGLSRQMINPDKSKHLEDNIRSKVEGWTKRFLSISGRATLINAVLGSISMHTISILPVPKGCINRLESLMSNFLWDTKRHWVSWATIFTPKCEGGLGIRNMPNLKQALLGKLA
ncbi:hypothetical protein QQ045_028147 [Rhodiola kirilowii]